METARTLYHDGDGAIYVVEENSTQDANAASQTPESGTLVKRLIATTPETRGICNDPLICGVRYTAQLQRACERVIRMLAQLNLWTPLEHDTTVMHLLRGGLNFGLREALNGALGWNYHRSAFVSAQRARNSDNPEHWHITEAHYQKISMPARADVVFGDVVATGTSLIFALRRLCEVALAEKKQIRSFTFFTIGSYVAEGVLSEVDALCRHHFPEYRGATIVYLEGRFDFATVDSPLTIKISGTDLLRSGGILAHEFFVSQMEHPAYPLERCTIYDAGSRAFDIEEYLEDVCTYWEKILELANAGTTFGELLRERMPELAPECFGNINLKELCSHQIKRLAALVCEPSG